MGASHSTHYTKQEYKDRMTEAVDKHLAEGKLPIPIHKGSKIPNVYSPWFSIMQKTRGYVPQRVDGHWKIEGLGEIHLPKGDFPRFYPEGGWDNYDHVKYSNAEKKGKLEDIGKYFNVGLVIQASEEWCLDVESAAALENLVNHLEENNLDAGILDKTYRDMSGNGGCHFRFNAPFESQTFGLDASPFGLEDIEIKNTGLILMPPSVHPNGNQYEVLQALPVQDAPDWLVDEVQRLSQADEGTSRSGQNPVGDYLFIPENQGRNTFITKLKGALSGRGLKPELVDEVASLINTHEESPFEVPLPDAEVRKTTTYGPGGWDGYNDFLSYYKTNGQGSQGPRGPYYKSKDPFRDPSETNSEVCDLLSMKDPGPIRWIVDNLFPRGLPCGFYGASGSLKSYLALLLGLHLLDQKQEYWMGHKISIGWGTRSLRFRRFCTWTLS